jgi:hypothetical protein
MGKNKKSEDKQERKSIFQALFSKAERDQEYVSDLKTQWGTMDPPNRVKFVVGAVAGLLLFIGALALALFVLSQMFG